MDAPTFARQSLQQAHLRLQGSIDGLTDAQAGWRPSPRSNSIGFILWHLGRVEDELVALEAGHATRWEQTWAAQFSHPVDTPARDEREILLGLALPPLDALRAFLAETYAQCDGFVSIEYRESATARFHEKSSHLRRAVSIGVGFDHGDDFAG